MKIKNKFYIWLGIIMFVFGIAGYIKEDFKMLLSVLITGAGIIWLDMGLVFERHK